MPLTLHAHGRPCAAAECTNPFAECTAFKHCASDYCSYGRGELSHGKSIAILSSPVVEPYSPHHFRGAGGEPGSDPADTYLLRTLVLPPPLAVILHYESCSYARWRDKFTDHARKLRTEGGRSDVRQAATFSLFYKQSIESCARLLAASSTQHAPGSAAAGQGTREAEEAGAAARALLASAKLEPPAVTASRPIEHARTLGRLTLLPPVAAWVAGGATATAERELERADAVAELREQ